MSRRCLEGPKAHMGGQKAHMGGPKAHMGGPKAHQTSPEGLEFEGRIAPSNSSTIYLLLSLLIGLRHLFMLYVICLIYQCPVENVPLCSVL